MSQHITPAKLDAFAKAVEQAAQEHLGSNGVRGVLVALDRDTYYPARMEFMRDPVSMAVDLTTDDLRNGFDHACGFIRVSMVDDMDDRKRVFHKQRW